MSNSAADLLNITVPIIQAPMAGSNSAELVIAVSEAGGLGSLPCALMNASQMEEQITLIRNQTKRPFNLNFFCHDDPVVSPQDADKWRDALTPYYDELAIERPMAPLESGRKPLDDDACTVIEQLRPNVVSFHFGLPEDSLYQRIKATGCTTLCSATTVDEAIWLESHGIDIIIAQGVEAGGHRGIFLDDNYQNQPGTMALVPQVVDNVSVPVIAAGGIADSRGINAAFALGATCVQMGSAFLFTKEAHPNPIHLEGLQNAKDNNTALTNIFSGRPARGVANRIMKDLDYITPSAPPFPLAGNDLTELKKQAEQKQLNDFSSLWSGQATALAKHYSGMGARDLIRELSSGLKLI